GGWLVQRFNPAAPFWVASVVMILSALILWRLLASYEATEEAAGPPADAMASWSERLRLLAAIVCWWLGFVFLNRFFGVVAESRWGFGEAQGDFLLGLFWLTVTIASIPAGMLGERLGRRRSIVLGTWLMAGAVAIMPLLPAVPLLVGLLIMLVGVGWAAVTVNSLPMLLDMGSETRLGRSTGLYYLAFAAAGLGGPWLLRNLAAVPGVAGIWLVSLLWIAALPLVGSMKQGSGEPTTIDN
ncbi:MAG: MFS transporter, partial [Ardenticatenaceae bacterium]